MTDRLSTKVVIPHPVAPDCPITGILEQLDGPTSSPGPRKITLILHGSMGHKDYLFQRRLAKRLPQDNFRFDFRGNHETPGTWKYGSFEEDVDDLKIVVEHLRQMGYVVSALVGHSRGSIVAFRWLCTAPEARHVTAFVNVSGRYRMHKVLDRPAMKVWKDGFEKDGYFDLHATVARKPFTTRITAAEVAKFIAWDSSLIWDRFPTRIHVLTLHGLSDEVVPPYDAHIIARALGGRSPGTHTLHMVEDADHNFSGRQDEVVDYILQWWGLCERQELVSSGVWMTGVRGKL